jgi:hypothetical protein
MRITGNLQDVKDRLPVPGATYRVRVVGVPDEAVKAKSGREMLEFKLQLTSPVGPEYWDTFTYRVVKQDSVGWVNRNMRDLYQCFSAPFDAGGFDTNDLLHREGNVVIEQTIYNDKPSNEIVELCKPA